MVIAVEQITANLEGAELVKESKPSIRRYPSSHDWAKALLYRRDQLWEAVLVYGNFQGADINSSRWKYELDITRGIDDNPYWAIVKALHQQWRQENLNLNEICGWIDVKLPEFDRELMDVLMPPTR